MKLRLGFVNSVGEQKGVDSLIITDMITLARNRAISDAILLSGDEDLRVGVQQAQEFGVRVHLLGIKPSRGSQSLALLQESDSTHEWEEGTVSGFLSFRKANAVSGDATTRDVSEVTQKPGHSGSSPTPSALEKEAETPAVPKQADTTATHIAAAAKEVALRLDLSDIAVILEAYEDNRQILRDIDRQLLGSSRSRVGRELESHEKKMVRSIFVAACKERISE